MTTVHGRSTGSELVFSPKSFLAGVFLREAGEWAIVHPSAAADVS